MEESNHLSAISLQPALRAPITEYDFSPVEAQLFKQALMELRAKDNEIGAMIRLVTGQNGLAGNWQLKPDGSGLLKREDPNSPAQANLSP